VGAPSRSKILGDVVDGLELLLLKLKTAREDSPHYRLVYEKVTEARDWLADYRAHTYRRVPAANQRKGVSR
jgi:hypothetical protein